MRRVTVSNLISSRYPLGLRPEDWDKRLQGVDTVQTTDGEQLTLWSDAQQSPPQSGWTILLSGKTAEDDSNGALWTLYGMKS